MDVIVDGNRDFSLQGEPEDVLSAVVAVSEFLQKKGRSILSVKTDGDSVPAEKLVDTLKNRPPGQVRELEITSEAIAKLVEASLVNLKETLPELPKACHDLAAIFQGSTPHEGFEPFQRLADLWAQVKSREVMVANSLGLNLESLQMDGRSVSELHGELNGFLEEAARAIESGDLILLGDLLEYELAPRAETEGQIVTLLQERAQGQAG